jgi:hypothetical protein
MTFCLKFTLYYKVAPAVQYNKGIKYFNKVNYSKDKSFFILLIVAYIGLNKRLLILNI